MMGQMIDEDHLINLTQYAPTPDQICVGVVNIEHDKVKSLLNVTLGPNGELPTMSDIQSRALALAWLAFEYGCTKAVIGGLFAMMAPLERALLALDITPCYAFSERVFEDVLNDDGTVTKVAVFKHRGFLEVRKHGQV